MTTQLIPLTLVSGEPRVDSRLVAAELGVAPRNTFELVENYSDQFQEFGLLPFETGAVKREGERGTKFEKFYLLNEDQTCFLLTLVRNTPQAVDLKKKLVRAFSQYRVAVEVGAFDTAHRLELNALRSELASCHEELLRLKPLWGKIARYKRLGLSHAEIGLLVGRSRDRARRHVRRLEACGLLPVAEPAQLSLLEG